MNNLEAGEGKRELFSDLDGVWRDSFSVFVETLAEILDRPAFSDEEVGDMRTLSHFGVIRYTGIPYRHAPELFRRGRELMEAKADRMDIVEGMPEAIIEVADHNFPIRIVTSSSPGPIERMLKKHQLLDAVTSIHPNAGLFNKPWVLLKLCHQLGIATRNAVYMGDEIRDMQAARLIGMPSIGVAWGSNTPESLLQKGKPTAFATTPADILPILESNQLNRR